jgi:hypothetical protein
MSIVIRDKIRRGEISFQIGDEVVVFHRKSNGHPRALKDGVSYIIKNIDMDGHITVAEHSSDGIGFLQSTRVHKMYMIKKSDLREFKLNKLFETN